MRFPWRRRPPTPVPAAKPRPPAVASAPSATPADLGDLEAQARYHRERLALYRARMHGAHATSVERLHELERASARADERLETARRLGHP